MPTYDFTRQGFLCKLPSEAGKHFYAMQRIYRPKTSYGGRVRESNYQNVATPLFASADEGFVSVGYGAILTAQRHNPLLKFVDKSGYDPIQPLILPKLDGFDPRDYQEEGFHIMTSHVGGICEIPMAGGKTELQLLIALAARESGNVLFVGPTKVVIENFIKRAKKYGIEVIRYVDTRNKVVPRNGLILVANPVAINNDAGRGANMATHRTITTLLMDEGQHLQAPTWGHLLEILINLERSYGFSGTAVDEAAKDFAHFKQIDYGSALVYSGTGPILFSRTPKQIDQYIERPRVVSVRHYWRWKRKSMVFEDNYKILKPILQKSKKRNTLIRDIILLLDKLDRTTIIPVSELEYGISIMESVKLPTIVCWYGSGNRFDWRGYKVTEDQIRQGLDAGHYRHVIVTQHADEGLDIPVLETCLLVEGGTASRAKQRAGRTARKGKVQRSVVINIGDSGNVVFEKHSAIRSEDVARYYETEALEVRGVAGLEAFLGIL